MHILVASQHFGNLMSKYLNGGSRQHKCMSGACLHVTDLLGKKKILHAVYTLNMLRPRKAILLVNDSSSLCRYWTRIRLGRNLLASVSSLFCIQMKKKQWVMDYNRLLETVSLPLFRIRICEEESEETAEAPRLWGSAWTYRAGSTEWSFSANAIGVVSTVCNENFNVLIIVFHSFFQTCSFSLLCPL